MENSDLRKARVGDKLWDILSGAYVRIIELRISPFPIILSSGYSCTCDGRQNTGDMNSRYFWEPITFEVPKPPKIVIKKMAKVWHHKDAWKGHGPWDVITDERFQRDNFYRPREDYVCHEYEVSIIE